MKTVLITGATSGIGWALAHLYAKQAYQVIACGRNSEKLALLTQQYQDIIPLTFDITKPEQIKLAAQKLSTQGITKIDVLLLNAGGCEYIDDAVCFDNELFERIITVNLIAIGHLLSVFVKQVASGGQIAVVSSSAALLPLPRAHAYGASKAGLDYLTKTLRHDLINEDITVTLIHPGFVKTELTDKNTFDMPFIMSSDAAALRIFNGINARKRYLHFPKRFTYLLKLFALLPDALWQRIAFRNKSS